MKKFLTLSFLAAFAVLLVIPTSAGAATANFQGSCAWGSGTFPNRNLNCVFDASRPTSNPSSCSPSTINGYFWDFGDGSTTFGFSSFVSHVYLPTHPCNYFVTLAVFCNNGDSATKGRIIDICIGTGGIPAGSPGWH